MPHETHPRDGVPRALSAVGRVRGVSLRQSQAAFARARRAVEDAERRLALSRAILDRHHEQTSAESRLLGSTGAALGHLGAHRRRRRADATALRSAVDEARESWARARGDLDTARRDLAAARGLAEAVDQATARARRDWARRAELRADDEAADGRRPQP